MEIINAIPHISFWRVMHCKLITQAVDIKKRFSAVQIHCMNKLTEYVLVLIIRSPIKPLQKQLYDIIEE